MSKAAEKYNRKGLRTRKVSTIIGVSLVLFVIGMVLSGVIGLDRLQKYAKENVVADLFFQPEYNDADIKQIEMQLKDWPEFSEVTFISPDRAMADFSGNDDIYTQEIEAIFDGDNPFPPTIRIKPNEKFSSILGMEQISSKIQNSFGDQLEEVSYDVNNLQQVNLEFKQYFVLFLIIAFFLIIVAVAMINNTIRLALYSKRFTIKTMQLVGAKSNFIRRPFLMESIFQGFVSAIIGLTLLVTLFFALNNSIDIQSIVFDQKSFLILSGVIFAIGVCITYVSTFFALNKYLRMKLDEYADEQLKLRCLKSRSNSI